MTHPLARVPILGQFVDERFLEHRRRASSLAGFASVFVAFGLLEYHYWHDHLWSWDLFAVFMVFVVVKLSTFAWYRRHE